METKPASALQLSDEIEFEFELMAFRKYKDGCIERLEGEEVVPPSDDLDGVSSKDVVIDSETGVSARLYLPLVVVEENKEGDVKRLPILVYFHGGGFCINTPFASLHHSYLNSLVSKAKVVAISINYRRATEHLLPVAYDDCYSGLQWVLSHCGLGGPDAWINEHGDLDRVYLAGDSAGANIVHSVAMRFGEEKMGKGTPQVLEGIVLVHPYFWGTERFPEELEKIKPEWLEKIDQIWPMVSGLEHDHPWINPTAEGAPSLAKLGCRRVLVVVAEEDIVTPRALLYYAKLGQSGQWTAATAELWETPGEFHVFHLYNPNSDKSKQLMDKLVSFFNCV